MTRVLTRFAVVILLAGSLRALGEDKLLTQKVLPLHVEVEAAQAAIAACAAMHVAVHAYVVDPSGNIRLLIIGDGSHYNTVEGARRKAYTAAVTGRPTIEWQRLLAGNPAAEVPTDPRMLFLGGAVPIKYQSEVIGALSVGGGAPDQDAVCAQAGVDKIQTYLQ